MQWACSAHGSPPIYHLGCSLALLLYELTWRGFRLPKVVDEGEYPLTAQFLLLGSSSTGKTTAFNSMQDFANAVWTQTSTKPEVDPWVELEGSMEGISSAIQDRYIERTDNTPVVLFDPEISKVFARREPLTDLLCKLADGRTIQSNYRGKQGKKRNVNADRIVNPRISALYCTTEAQLAPHFKDSHRMGGMFPRLIWLRPDFTKRDIWLSQDHMGAKPLGAIREDAIFGWSQWIVELEIAASEQGRRFEFTPEAHGVLNNELFQPIIDQFEPDSIDDNMHAVRVRLLEKARVFAALHAAMRYELRVLPEDVHFAANLVRLLLSMLTLDSPVRDLGAHDDFRAAKRVERVILDAGDTGMLRRELYIRLRVSKKVLDEALEQLIDQESIFLDNAMTQRTGRYLHSDSPLGREMRAIAAKQLEEEAELAATLKSTGVTRVPWRMGRRGSG